ncbi:hypothetical protein IGI49_004976 [Enterococcus sp. AZ071]
MIIKIVIFFVGFYIGAAIMSVLAMGKISELYRRLEK